MNVSDSRILNVSYFQPYSTQFYIVRLHRNCSHVFPTSFISIMRTNFQLVGGVVDMYVCAIDHNILGISEYRCYFFEGQSLCFRKCKYNPNGTQAGYNDEDLLWSATVLGR